jgi:hypothetical protein
MEILSNENGIKIEKNKDNLFQISFLSKYNKSSNFLEIIQQNGFYELLRALNQNIIESAKINHVNGVDNIEYIFNFGNYMSDFFEKNEDVKYCLSLINKTTKLSNTKFEIKGTSNNQYKGSVKQSKITDIVIIIDFVGPNVVVFLSYKNNDLATNNIHKKALVKCLYKIMSGLKTYIE